MSSNLPPEDIFPDPRPPSAEPGVEADGPREEVLEAVLLDDRDSRQAYGVTPPRRRRRWLPIALFMITCFSTYAAGCYGWNMSMFGDRVLSEVKQGETLFDANGRAYVAPADGVGFVDWTVGLRRNWRDGLTYMICVMGILLFHEMGHFLLTLRYKVPASYPFFIPVPFMITGTMGAVIGMDPYKANRKEVFDIGLAGPLAGLILTIPFVIIGLSQAETRIVPSELGRGDREYGDPLLVTMLTPVFHDVADLEAQAAQRTLAERAELREGEKEVTYRYVLLVNPIYMAGWVGMLVTGLNMLPLSQLDGGHVSYAILGRYARWLGRGFLIVAIAFIVLTDSYNWTLMLLLVILIGTDHPPTADDTVKLGPLRWTIGFLSLSIPILCFTPFPFIVGGQ